MERFSGPLAERLGRWAVLVLVAIAAGASAAVGIYGAATTTRDGSVDDVAILLSLGAVFIAGGLVAWWTRPEHRTGRLMTAAGLASVASSWQAVDDGWFFIAGALASLLALAAFVHLVLAFPDGVLRRRLDRAVVAAAYVLVAAVLAAVPFIEPQTVEGCRDCPANPVVVATNSTVSTILLGIVNGAVGVGILAMLILLLRRWRRATAAERRTIAPVLWAAVVVNVAAILQLVVVLINEDAAVVPEVIYLAGLYALPLAFMVSLLRSRLQRSTAMQGLVVQLAGARSPSDLQATLAAALGDPGVRIAFWFPEREAYADGEGRPIEVPERGSTVVERDGERIARLVHDPGLHDEPELLQAVSAAAAIGLERARLEAALRARLEELHASRARIVEAGYTTRRRIERDLHDGAQQRLVALSLALRMIRNRVVEDEATVGLIDAAQAELAEALAELRELARGIHPAILTDRGLEPALQALADRAPVPTELEVEAGLGLSPAHEAAIYFVASEALANMVKHSGARQARLRVARQELNVVVDVCDDGVGGAAYGGGTGLSGLRDRVEALDGRFEIRSPPGEGTCVRATLPAPVTSAAGAAEVRPVA
jgi:signal transduction histidine kinase